MMLDFNDDRTYTKDVVLENVRYVILLIVVRGDIFHKFLSLVIFIGEIFRNCD